VNNYLLDTNVVFEMRKIQSGRADSGVVTWAASVPVAALYLSVITLQEIEIGVLLAQRRDVAQGALLGQWFEQRVLPAFSGRILPIDSSVARRSAALHVPNPCPFRDSLIGATALVHGMTMVTRNTADFQSFELELLNPWAG
jgi:predicted nucleic acid-binding protein